MYSVSAFATVDRGLFKVVLKKYKLTRSTYIPYDWPM